MTVLVFHSPESIKLSTDSGCLMSVTLNPTVWTQFCTACGLWLLDTSLNSILFFNRSWQVIVSLINDMVKAHEL